MSSAESCWSKWSPVSVAFLALAAFAIPALGQEVDKTSAPVGYVDDWSTHHVTFSNPGTREDAVKNGTLDKWLKITSNPRYVMQQLKRGAGARPAVADPNLTTADPNLARETVDAVGGMAARPVAPARPRPVPKNPIKKDWSMISGTQTGESLTLTVTCTTNCSGGVSSSSQISIAGPTGFTTQTLQGSAPVAEVWTVQFSNSTAPVSGSSLTIGSVKYTFLATPLSVPATGCSVADVDSSTGATDLLDALTAAGATNTTYECATGVGANTAVTATRATRTVTLTAATAGSVGFTFTPSGTTNTTNTETHNPSDGTNSATTFKYTTSSVADTQAQLAADLVTALGMNATVTGAMTVANSPGTNQVTLTTTPGATGYSATDATFSALSGTGSFSGGAASTVNPNTYPAKFSTLGTSGASCSDYVVYPTGFAGSGTQATIIGYDNIYGTSGPSGTGCGSGASPTVYVPTVAFAYNTGGTAGLSPVISIDGTQVAFVETVGTAATLVILKVSLTSGGTLGAPTFGSGAGSVSNGSYRGCTAPCYTTFTFSGSANDSNSSPFYIYPTGSTTGNNDIIYVGDDSGKVHKFTGVFVGTPAEAGSPWPVTASTETSPALTSLVYDTGGSALVFVGNATGYLHSISTGTTPAVLTSDQMECGTYGFVDGPLLDPSTENVYMFIGDGCPTVSASYVNRFPAGTAITGTFGANNVSFGNSATNDAATIQYDGTFDNTYYAGTGTTGNLYTCVNGRVYQITMATLSGTGTVTVNTYNTPVGTVSDAAACSPVTEFNVDSTHDWIFTSVLSGSSVTGCTTATGCLLNYNVHGAGTTGSPTAGQSVAGGASGIIIDNLSTLETGAEEIYYSSQANQTCAGNGTTGNGTGICAIQASQSNP